jgi:hypothetical protein
MVVIEHTFVKRCEILEPLSSIYTILSLGWLSILILYWLHTFILMKQHTMTLQRVLMLLPSIKLAEILITALYLDKCPWLTTVKTEDKYIEMSRISIITLTYTMLLSLISVISNGWQTLTF